MTDAERIAALEGCYTSVLHDVLRARGVCDFTLPPRIRPLQPERTLTGPVWTIEGEVAEGTDPHETLLAWTGLLSKAPAGHIWTCQPHTDIVAQMGELSAETLHRKGVLGCVTDAALRDTNFILDLGFRCWGTHHTPLDIVGRWLPKATDAPITIGDVTIAPGDWLHGDRDGMVRIPGALVDEIIPEAVTAMNTESKVRKAILEGTDPQEAYLKWGKF